jgi:hypothetical protein
VLDKVYGRMCFRFPEEEERSLDEKGHEDPYVLSYSKEGPDRRAMEMRMKASRRQHASLAQTRLAAGRVRRRWR